MTASSDPRSARSREALIRAAITLVDEYETEAISVTHLAARAHVTRMTFYQHFADRDALLQTAGVARFEAALDDFRLHDGSSFEAALVSLFRHFAEYRKFYRRLNEGRSGLQVYRAIQEYIARQIATSTLFAGTTLSALESAFLGGGAMAYTTDWLDNHHPEVDAAEKAAANLTKLITQYRNPAAHQAGQGKAAAQREFDPNNPHTTLSTC